MSKNYRTGILITGDSSGAVRSIKLTEEQLEKLNQTKDKASSRAKALVSQWGSMAASAAKWSAGIAAGAVAGGAAIVKNAAESAREIQNLSRVANTSTTEFQRWSAGAKTVGIEQDKLGDMLKDMSDRVGDFLTTGGGPMADFFETIAPRVGVTAEQFRNLSGPQALQLYVSSLEKANLSQNEMAFYMEAVASDATALLPLLRDNGAEINRLGDRAERLGAVLSDVEVAQLVEVRNGFDDLSLVVEGLGNKLAVAALPHIRELTSLMQDPATIEGIQSIAQGLINVTNAAITGAAEMANFSRWVGESLAAARHGIAGDDIVRLQQEADKIRGLLESWNPLKRTVLFGTGGVIEYWSEAELKAELARIESAIAAAAADMAAAARAAKLDEALIPPGLLKRAESLATTYGQTGRAFVEAEEAKKKALESAGKALDKYFEQETKAAEARASTISEARRQVEVLQRQLVAVGQGESAVKALNRELAIENALRSESAQKLLPHQREELARLIAQQHDLTEQLATTQQAAQEAANESARVWEEATDRINATVADGWTQTWQAAFEGTKVGFSDLADNLKQGLYRLLGEMSHMALTRPIMLSLSAALPGGAQASGGLGAIASGGQSLSSLFSLGSLMKGGGILAGANNAIGQFAGNAIQFAYNQGWTTAGNLGVQWANNMASMPGGMAGGLAINALAGYAGNWAGNQIGGALTGKQANSAWGGTIGSVVGSIWGPLGTAIGGAIGGLVDSIFGSSGKKRVTLGVDTDPNVIAGSRGYTDHQVRGASGILYSGRETRGDEDVANKMVDLFALTDTALTGVFRTLTGITPDLTGQSLAGKMHQAGKKGEGSFFGSAEYNKLMEEDLRGATDEFVRAWVNRVNEVTEQAVDFAPLFELAQEGELLADALVRLDTQFHGVDATLRALDLTAYDTSTSGMKMADSLVQAAGGLDRFITGTDAYYRNFYGQSERFASVSRQLAAEFDTLGQLIPATRDGVRDIVDSLDLMTDAGQKTFAAIMNASEGLSEYYSLLEGYQQSITSGFDDFRDQLMMDILGDAGAQYDYLKAQADALGQVLPTLQDADAIAKVKEEILDLSRQAYGLLDQEGKRQAAPEYVSMIDELERVSIEQLKQAQQQSADNADRVAGAVEKAMAHVTNEFQRVLAAVVQDQQQAGQLLMSATSQFGSFASSFPGRIQVNVNLPEAGAY